MSSRASVAAAHDSRRRLQARRSLSWRRHKANRLQLEFSKKRRTAVRLHMTHLRVERIQDCAQSEATIRLSCLRFVSCDRKRADAPAHTLHLDVMDRSSPNAEKVIAQFRRSCDRTRQPRLRYSAFTALIAARSTRRFSSRVPKPAPRCLVGQHGCLCRDWIGCYGQ